MNFPRLGIILTGLLLSSTSAFGQATVRPCVTTSGAVSGCPPVSASNPLPVSGTFTPGGTQDINIAQILGAAPSLTNPLWVFPGTGATFPVSGSVVLNPSSAAAAGIAPVATGVLATSLVLKASPGNLYSLNIAADSTLAGAAWWAMVFDATAAPAAGAVTPKKCYSMALGTTMLSLAFPTPLRLATGVSVTVSTAGCFTQTDSAHAFISGEAS